MPVAIQAKVRVSNSEPFKVPDATALLMRTIWPTTLLAAFVVVGVSCGGDEIVEDRGGDVASVRLVIPAHETRVAGGLAIVMEVDNEASENAQAVNVEDARFDLLIDEWCFESGSTIPIAALNVHFERGVTGSIVYLEPGTHQLCLQLAPVRSGAGNQRA